MLGEGRKLSWDWYEGTIPGNVNVDESAFIETAFSFQLCRSKATVGVCIGRGSCIYMGTMFDIGPRGQVSIGSYSLIHGLRVVCDQEVTIGDYALISWNVVIMDTYRAPFDPAERKAELERVPFRVPRILDAGGLPKPVRIGPNVWIGFDACVLPGVTIGEGAIVGARSAIFEDVLPYTVVVGNPARAIRRLDAADERSIH